MLLPHVACGVELLLFLFWQPEKQALEHQVLLCVVSAWFLWSNRQEEELFGWEIPFVLTEQCGWVLNAWPSVKPCHLFFPCYGATRFPRISDEV